MKSPRTHYSKIRRRLLPVFGEICNERAPHMCNCIIFILVFELEIAAVSFGKYVRMIQTVKSG